MKKKYEKIDLKFISKETNYYISYIIRVIL